MLTEKFREYCPREMQDTVEPVHWRQALMKAAKPLEDLHNAGKLQTLKDEEDAFTDFYYVLVNEAGLSMDRNTANIISRDRTYVYDGKYILTDSVHPVLDALKRQGYRLGVLSDTWPSIVPMMQHFNLEQYFDACTYSYEVRAFKPDREIYEDALKKLGLPGEETVFIDDVERNLDGAAALGIHGIQAHFKERIPVSGRYPCLFDMMDLPGLIADLQSSLETSDTL